MVVENKHKDGSHWIRIEKEEAHYISPEQRLANAVIQQAVSDYRIASLRSRAFFEEKNAVMKDLEQFFLSDWFRMLTKVNGEWLLAKLEEEDESVRRKLCVF